MKKDGFVSTALVYTFFVLFLMLMVFLINNYSSRRYLLYRQNNDIKEELYKLRGADIDLYIMIWNNTTKEYEYSYYAPSNGTLDRKSYCKNGGTLNYENGEITINAKRRDECHAYFN